MAEFAQNPTGHNKAFGDCHNPWNLPYITGGSSSGSGASVAARFNYMALGSDTGGSIRLPGLGLRRHRDQADADPGVALRRDAAVVLARQCRPAGPHRARLRARADGDRRARSARPDQRARAGAGLRGGAERRSARRCASACRPTSSSTAPTRRWWRRWRRALAVLSGARRQRQPLRPAADGRGRRLWRHRLPRRGGADPRANGCATRPAGLWRAYQRADVSRLCHPGDLLRRGAEPPRTDPARRSRPRCSAQVDVLVTPTIRTCLPTLAETDIDHGPPGTETEFMAVSANTRPFNYLGLPAISVPCGFDPNGCPIGLQIAGRPFAEAPRPEGRRRLSARHRSGTRPPVLKR